MSVPLTARRPIRSIHHLALLAFAALLALAAALALAAPSSAAPPADLELLLSLANDSDNVVPPDSTITVAASLRHSGIGQNIEIESGTLRISGAFEFEDVQRTRVAIAGQQVGAAPWRGGGAEFGDRFGAFGGAILDDDTFFVKALQNIFTTTWQTGPGKAYVYDVPTKTEIGVINPPSGASSRSFSEGFAAYQEDADTGWIFIGSWRDAVTVPGATCYERTRWGQFFATWRTSFTNAGTSCREVGRLYIYKVDRSVSPMTVDSAPCATVTPSAAHAVFQKNSSGAESGHLGGQFGAGVVVNEATDTLVVGAPKMHLTGAARVFTKPAGAGGWCDLEYDDGVHLTPTTMPTSGGTWNNDATNLQKSYSGRHWSTDAQGSGFGQHIAISDDGSTIAFGSFLKRYNDSNSDLASGKIDVGEVDIYVRPSGGWAAAASPDARLFVTPEVNSLRLGQYLAVSHDGMTIAASAPQRPQNPPDWPGKVYLWNRPGGGWTADITGPHATLTSANARNGDLFGHLGVDFNHDGSRLVVSDHKYQDADREATDRTDRNSNAAFFGRAWMFSGTNGAWADATTDDATQIVSPQPRAAARFGIARFASDGRQVIITQHESASADRTEVGPGAVWLFDEDLEPQVFASSTCEIDSGFLLNDSGDDVNTCQLTLPSTEIVIPAGIPDGAFTISGSVTVEGQTYSGTLEVRISATIKEVAQTTLDFANDDRGTLNLRDDRPWPDTIAPGESTVLRLSVLSETDHAPAPGSITSILLNTTVGALSTNINDTERDPAAFTTARRNQDGCIGTGGFTCQVPTAAAVLTSDNTDEILVTLTAPRDAAPGRAVVTARVISTAGDTFTASRTVAITGPFDALQIAEPPTSILNVGTPDDGADRDDRDLLRLAVTAQDAAGNDIIVPGTAAAARGRPRAIPTHRLVIIGPDDKRAPAGISARWAVSDVNAGLAVDADGNPLIEIDVDAAPSAALSTGVYTLEARVDRRLWTREFRVAGGPAAISITEAPSTANVDSRITISVAVTDAEDRPVADGTPVDFSEQRIGTTPVLIILSPATQRTVDGAASVEMLVINAGSAYIRAAAGDVADVRVIQFGAAAAAGPAVMPDEQLSVTEPGNYSVWLSNEPVVASSLLPALEGAGGVWQWNGQRWIGYSVVTGLLVPGSVDFLIERGSILWLSLPE